ALEVRRSADGPTVITTTGELRARHVVVADGLRSSLRHQLGWTIGPRPPHRYGIVGHWQIDGPLDPWVRITFADGLELYEGPGGGGGSWHQVSRAHLSPRAPAPDRRSAPGRRPAPTAEPHASTGGARHAQS